MTPSSSTRSAMSASRWVTPIGTTAENGANAAKSESR
ncbi:MAG: hypothetical protein JWQ81_5532 [Amycolatopsis sp.]|jgi:hypothetical protein|nr:hypothetical protein [Amycolatopsis sp.]